MSTATKPLSLSDRIRILASQGLKDTEIARRLGTSRQTVWYARNCSPKRGYGARKPRPPELCPNCGHVLRAGVTEEEAAANAAAPKKRRPSGSLLPKAERTG